MKNNVGYFYEVHLDSGSVLVNLKHVVAIAIDGNEIILWNDPTRENGCYTERCTSPEIAEEEFELLRNQLLLW